LVQGPAFLPRLAIASFLACAAPAGAAAAAEGPIKVVALGDSLTAGYGLAAAAAFPTRLEQALRARGAEVTIANAGVSGDTAKFNQFTGSFGRFIETSHELME